MKKTHTGTGLVIFVLFFGVALAEAFREGNWLIVAFWIVMGSLFYYLDNLKKWKAK